MQNLKEIGEAHRVESEISIKAAKRPGWRKRKAKVTWVTMTAAWPRAPQAWRLLGVWPWTVRGAGQRYLSDFWLEKLGGDVLLIKMARLGESRLGECARGEL